VTHRLEQNIDQVAEGDDNAYLENGDVEQPKTIGNRLDRR
jgi:hypothetical protein